VEEVSGGESRYCMRDPRTSAEADIVKVKVASIT